MSNASNDASHRELWGWADNPSCPPSWQVQIAQAGLDDEPLARRLAAKTNLCDEAVAILEHHSSPLVLRKLLQSGYRTETLVRRGLASSNEMTRMRAAEACTDPDVLATLAKDSSTIVRWVVSQHPHATEEARVTAALLGTDETLTGWVRLWMSEGP